MSLQESPAALRRRLMNPPNAVTDHGIDLRRRFRIVEQPKEIIPEPKPQCGYFEFHLNPLRHLRGGQSRFPRYGESTLVVARSSLTVNEIIRFTAAYYKVRYLDLVSERRDRATVRPRQVAMWLAKSLTSKSHVFIGRQIGGRDHTTILHGCRKIERLRDHEPELQAQLDELMFALRSTSPENRDATQNQKAT